MKDSAMTMNSNDNNKISLMSTSEKQKALLEMGYIYYVQAGLAFILFIISMLLKRKFRGVVFLLFTFVFIAFGLEYLLSSEEKKNEFLTSKYVNDKIKAYKKSGRILNDDDIASIKFANDPIYKRKVIEKVHNDADLMYSSKIHTAETELNRLIERRNETLAFIKEQRWQVYDQNLKYNYTEGKIVLFGQTALFSELKGTELKEDSEKKLFKTICKHLGVVIDLNGFKREIVYLNVPADKNSQEYKAAFNNAVNMLNMITQLARTPVPKDYIKPEDDERIINLNKEIAQARINLDLVKQNVPTYEIPQKYLKEID